jgi:PqqD family protein of HPr-rel-A system
MQNRFRWRAADPLRVTRHWAGEAECVVYSPRSGDVHLLNPAAAALLEAISDHALNADELIERLAAAAGRAPDEEFTRAVEDALTILDREGLIEPQLS